MPVAIGGRDLLNPSSIKTNFSITAPNAPSITPPSGGGSFGILDPIVNLGKWALQSTGTLGTDASTFAEQDIIRPLETVGNDVYNVGDTAVDTVRGILTFGKNVNTGVTTLTDTTKVLRDQITTLTNTITKWLTGGSGTGLTNPIVDLSGLNALLAGLSGGQGNPVQVPISSGSGGGTDYTSLIVIGGIIAATVGGLYYLSRGKYK